MILTLVFLPKLRFPGPTRTVIGVILRLESYEGVGANGPSAAETDSFKARITSKFGTDHQASKSTRYVTRRLQR
jgi:hypothetical protein